MNNDTRQIIAHHTPNSTTIETPQMMSGDLFTNSLFHASGRMNATQETHYVYSDRMIYRSDDGLSWINLGSTTLGPNSILTPWGKGKSFIANPNNDELYSGGFQFVKTKLNKETEWTNQYDYWWKYYDRNLSDSKDNMHVDITGIEYYEKANGTPFFIILNHAGVHVSYDNMNSTENLGLDHLNCVTLYDHATSPDGTIFFGAQDKGTFSFQEPDSYDHGMIESINQTTGDGMRELFFNDGKSFFGFLQNGIMICKTDFEVSTPYYSWNLPGNHIPGWITPVENHPNPSSKSCYVAGGNIHGGDGSYLIKMSVSFEEDGTNLQWHPFQFNHDFRLQSHTGKGIIKALSASTADTNRLYVATSDASFFASSDGGMSWSRSNTPISNYFLPWDIAVSKTNADSLFICGTGWSNSGVFISSDGGVNFQALGSGQPLATYFDIALSDDNQYLFAATSEGPWAFDFSEQSWFSLADETTPIVEFRSVEYVQSPELVRYGTYGRGLWDYRLEEFILDTITNDSVITDTIPDIGTPMDTASNDSLSTFMHHKEWVDFHIYPNPASDFIRIENTNIELDIYEIYDASGKLIDRQTLNENQRIDIHHLDNGMYFLRLLKEHRIIYTGQFLKKRG